MQAYKDKWSLTHTHHTHTHPHTHKNAYVHTHTPHMHKSTNHLLIPQLRPCQLNRQASKFSVSVSTELECRVLVLQLLDGLQFPLHFLQQQRMLRSPFTVHGVNINILTKPHEVENMTFKIYVNMQPQG